MGKKNEKRVVRILAGVVFLMLISIFSLIIILPYIKEISYWRKTKEQNTFEAYVTYLCNESDYNLRHKEEAEDSLDNITWRSFEASGTIADYQSYLSEIDINGTIEDYSALLSNCEKEIRYFRNHWRVAQERIDSLVWVKAVMYNSPSSYYSYLDKQPNGIHVREAQEHIDRFIIPDSLSHQLSFKKEFTIANISEDFLVLGKDSLLSVYSVTDGVLIDTFFIDDQGISNLRHLKFQSQEKLIIGTSCKIIELDLPSMKPKILIDNHKENYIIDLELSVDKNHMVCFMDYREKSEYFSNFRFSRYIFSYPEWSDISKSKFRKKYYSGISYGNFFLPITLVNNNHRRSIFLNQNIGGYECKISNDEISLYSSYFSSSESRALNERVSVSPQGNIIALYSKASDVLRIVDVTNPQIEKEFSIPNIENLLFTPCGNYIWTSTEDGIISTISYNNEGDYNEEVKRYHQIELIVPTVLCC